ncbi:hypothetical protein [Streptomyces mirabilis]|uniref:hypothetical protein n=1 Tax=Streptomyces mirabilis TaxID=68239 RepID=UPI0033B7A1F9
MSERQLPFSGRNPLLAVWGHGALKHYTCNHKTGTREILSPMLNDKNTTGFTTAWSYIGDDPYEMYARTGSC